MLANISGTDFKKYDINHITQLTFTAIFAPMKFCLVIITCITLIKPIFPVIDYVIHYDFIIKELCENRTKPQLHCNGKCHLKKELAKASETEKSDKKESNKQSLEILFLETCTFSWQPMSITIPFLMNSRYNNIYVFYKEFSVFHPPVLYN